MKAAAFAVGALAATVSAAAEEQVADASQAICPASGPQACECLNWSTQAYAKQLPAGAQQPQLLDCAALHAAHQKRSPMPQILNTLGNAVSSLFGGSSSPAPQQAPQGSSTTINGPLGTFITVSNPWTVSSPSGSTTTFGNGNGNGNRPNTGSTTTTTTTTTSGSNGASQGGVSGLVNSIFGMLPNTIWGASSNPSIPATSAGATKPATPSPAAAAPIVEAPKVACGPGQPTCKTGSYCDGQPLCSLDQFCAGVCLPTLSAQLSGKSSKVKRADQEQPFEVRRAVWQSLLDSGEYVLIEAQV